MDLAWNETLLSIVDFAAGGGLSEFPPIGFAAGGDTAMNGFSFERLTAFDNCISKRDASINGCSLERDTAINSGFVCKRHTADRRSTDAPRTATAG